MLGNPSEWGACIQRTEQSHIDTQTKPLYANKHEGETTCKYASTCINCHILNSSASRTGTNKQQQTTTLFNQVPASCTDTNHRRCTFITRSRNHPHSSLSLPPFHCLNRPPCLFSSRSVSWSCRCCCGRLSLGLRRQP